MKIKEDCILFLDVKVKCSGSTFIILGLAYFHGDSHHHPEKERSLITTVFQRADQKSDERSKPRELQHVRDAYTHNLIQMQMLTKQSIGPQRAGC